MSEKSRESFSKTPPERRGFFVDTGNKVHRIDAMKINVDGQEMELDVKRARELGVLSPVFRHQIGNHYVVKIAGRNELYVLAVVGLHDSSGNVLMTLIDIYSGTRKTEPQEVKNCLDLTLNEWENICTTSPDRVRYVSHCDVTKEMEKVIQQRW